LPTGERSADIRMQQSSDIQGGCREVAGVNTREHGSRERGEQILQRLRWLVALRGQGVLDDLKRYLGLCLQAETLRQQGFTARVGGRWQQWLIVEGGRRPTSGRQHRGYASSRSLRLLGRGSLNRLGSLNNHRNIEERTDSVQGSRIPSRVLFLQMTVPPGSCGSASVRLRTSSQPTINIFILLWLMSCLTRSGVQHKVGSQGEPEEVIPGGNKQLL
jgi:hypothetical protein